VALTGELLAILFLRDEQQEHRPREVGSPPRDHHGAARASDVALGGRQERHGVLLSLPSGLLMCSGCCGKNVRADAQMSGCSCLVFVTRNGTPLDAHNVKRDFRKVIEAAGLTGREWTPRELRQSSVSLLSDAKVPVEIISRLGRVL
jgi:hypothetical protein